MEDENNPRLMSLMLLAVVLGTTLGYYVGQNAANEDCNETLANMTRIDAGGNVSYGPPMNPEQYPNVFHTPAERVP